MPYVKLVGSINRHTNAVAEIILESVNGSPTKVARIGVPVDLDEKQIKKLESKGYLFQPSSLQELAKYENNHSARQAPGADVVSSAPIFGTEADSQEEVEEELSYDYSVSGPPQLEQRPGRASSAGVPKITQRQGDAEDS